MDEAASPPLHRWLSFCRLLMLFHPRVGAQNYALHMGASADLKPGWNAIHRAAGSEMQDNYIWIGPEGGRNTEQKPDVPEAEINHVFEDALPPFAGSAAFRQLQLLATTLGERDVPGYRTAQRDETMVCIDIAALAPLRGPMPSAADRIAQDLDRLKQAIAEGRSVKDMCQPLVDLVRDALNFRMTLTHASDMLAVLLLHYMRLPSPLDRTSLPERVSASIDHLIERVLVLKQERQGLKLTPFYQATWLALLYGNTAMVMCERSAEMTPSGTKERRSFERRSLYIDEVMAHELAPCLMHPVDLMPFGIPEFFHARTLGIVDPGGIYPGAEGQGRGPIEDAQAMWKKIETYSTNAKDVDISATIDGENSPLSDKDRERIFTFHVTMQLGRGR